jgi:hypothetical protein
MSRATRPATARSGGAPGIATDLPVREDASMIRTERRRLAITALLVAAFVGTGRTQTPPAQSPAPAPSAGDSVIVVDKPTYVTIALETTVNRPVAEVWKRVGGYCAIGEWFQMAAGCKILSGTDNEIGAVRSVANEVLVGQSQYSYTYTQPVRAGRPYNLYHGTLEARPLTDTTTKLLYTLVYDNSMLPDDAAKEKDRASRTATFTRALSNMKTLAEGGTLPPR